MIWRSETPVKFAVTTTVEIICAARLRFKRDRSFYFSNVCFTAPSPLPARAPARALLFPPRRLVRLRRPSRPARRMRAAARNVKLVACRSASASRRVGAHSMSPTIGASPLGADGGRHGVGAPPRCGRWRRWWRSTPCRPPSAPSAGRRFSASANAPRVPSAVARARGEGMGRVDRRLHRSGMSDQSRVNPPARAPPRDQELLFSYATSTKFTNRRSVFVLLRRERRDDRVDAHDVVARQQRRVVGHAEPRLLSEQIAKRESAPATARRRDAVYRPAATHRDVASFRPRRRAAATSREERPSRRPSRLTALRMRRHARLSSDEEHGTRARGDDGGGDAFVREPPTLASLSRTLPNPVLDRRILLAASPARLTRR